MQTQVGALEAGAVQDKIEIKSAQISMADKERRHLTWAQVSNTGCHSFRAISSFPHLSA
jgi:hypothetical protein